MKGLVFTVLFLILSVGSIGAATRYASPGGSGLTCSEGSPCQLLTGIGQTQAGDTLYLRGGTYDVMMRHGINMNFNSGTSYSNAVTIESYPGETAILKPIGGPMILGFGGTNQYIIFSGGANRGLVFDAADLDENYDAGSPGVPGHLVQGEAITCFGTGPHHLKFDNVEVKNAGNQGYIGTCANMWFTNSYFHHNGDTHGDHNFYISESGPASADLLIENSEISYGGGYGIQIYAGPTPRPIIRNNYIHHNAQGVGSGTDGSMTIRAFDGLFYNNIFANEPYAVDLQGGSNNRFYNNTIYQMTFGGFQVLNTNGAVIANNFGSGFGGGYGMVVNWGGNTSLTQTTNLTSATPAFVDAAGGNFRLCTGPNQPAPACPAPSQAINAGTNFFGAGVTTDKDGNPRPPTGPFELGAYEVTTASNLIINITSPTAGINYSTTASTVNLAGIASSNVTVTGISWANDRGGSGTASGTTSWSVANVVLQPGNNILTVTATDSSAATAQAVLTVFRASASPVLAMGFEEASGNALDSSGNSNHGILGASVVRSAGKIGAGLEFNGATDSVLTVPNSPSLAVSNAFTISLSVYPTSAMTDFRAMLVLNYVYFMYAGSDGYCGTGMPIGGFTTVTGIGTICQGLTLPLNTWTDLTVTYDGANLRWYRNGLLALTQAATGTVNSTSGTLTIGASEYDENFVGRIDHVRVYPRALSLAEIQSDINAAIGAITVGGVIVKMGPLSKQVYGPDIKEVYGVQ